MTFFCHRVKHHAEGYVALQRGNTSLVELLHDHLQVLDLLRLRVKLGGEGSAHSRVRGGLQNNTIIPLLKQLRCQQVF